MGFCRNLTLLSLCLTFTLPVYGAAEQEATSCYRIGPFSEVDARRWRSELSEQKLQVWLKPLHTEADLLGTWLLIPTTGMSDALEVMVTLEALGVTDSQIIRKGNFYGWVSIGIFSKPEGVTRRLVQVSPLGRQVIKHKRYRAATRYDVEFKATPSVLKTAGLDNKRLETDCDPNR